MVWYYIESHPCVYDATVRVTVEHSPVAWPWLPVPFSYFYLSIMQQRSMLVCLQHPRSQSDAAAENNKETCAFDIFLRRVKIHKETKGVLI